MEDDLAARVAALEHDILLLSAIVGGTLGSVGALMGLVIESLDSTDPRFLTLNEEMRRVLRVLRDRWPDSPPGS